ncbi:MAG: hypothetical protein K0R31_889 [Clostridiales bacterium]|jgi:hypothetical protein|nr:hypothetical protein [Clostridiales bacterium]
MKIFFIRKRSLKKFAIAVTVVIVMLAAAVLTMKMNVTSVFSVDREIPIYYVDMKEKAAAITFDCAWGAHR